MTIGSGAPSLLSTVERKGLGCGREGAAVGLLSNCGEEVHNKEGEGEDR
jgi:hypothetical protein